MATALLPGTFDPVTLGHLDVAARAAQLFDEVVLAVGNNFRKTPWFSTPERVRLLEESLAQSGVPPEKTRVVTFQGLVVDCAREQNASFIVKGVRGASDFPHEEVQATTNRQIAGLETLFLLADPRWALVSSSLVRELATWGADVSLYVPPAVNAALAARRREPTQPTS